MRTISLIQLPGVGRTTPTVASGTTLAQFAEAQGIANRQLCLNGEIVPKNQWDSVDLSAYEGRVEIAALAGSKGN